MVKKHRLNLKSGKKNKGFILSLDVSIAIFIAFILIAVSVYYVGLASEESLSKLQLLRAGSDILAILDYENVIDGLDKIEVQNEMKTLLPPGYAMRVMIRGTFPFESGTETREDPVPTPYTMIKDTNKNWKTNQWKGYDIILRPGTSTEEGPKRIESNTNDELTVNEAFGSIKKDDKYEIVSKQTVGESGTAASGTETTLTINPPNWVENQWAGWDVIVGSDQRTIDTNTEDTLMIIGEFTDGVTSGDEYKIVFQHGIVAESYPQEPPSNKFIIGGKRTFVIYHEPEEYFATADFWIWLI